MTRQFILSHLKCNFLNIGPKSPTTPILSVGSVSAYLSFFTTITTYSHGCYNNRQASFFKYADFINHLSSFSYHSPRICSRPCRRQTWWSHSPSLWTSKSQSTKTYQYLRTFGRYFNQNWLGQAHSYRFWQFQTSQKRWNSSFSGWPCQQSNSSLAFVTYS